MVTQAQRENRALFNLARNHALTFGQLRCASVNTAALEQLQADRFVANGHTNDRGACLYAITPAGHTELERRLIAGVASTITHDERSHA